MLRESFEKQRQAALRPLERGFQEQERTLTRELGAGRIPTGARTKLLLQGKQQLAERGSEVARGVEGQRIGAEAGLLEQEEQRLRAEQEATRGRQFAGEQARLGREFAGEQARLGREFQRGETERAREFARGERLGTQEFQAGEAERQREIMRNQLQFERDKTFGIYQTDEQGEPVLDQQGNPVLTKDGILTLQKRQFDLDKATTSFNKLVAFHGLDFSKGGRFLNLFGASLVDDPTIAPEHKLLFLDALNGLINEQGGVGMSPQMLEQLGMLGQQAVLQQATSGRPVVTNFGTGGIIGRPTFGTGGGTSTQRPTNESPNF
jgi:hypothetical protein